MTEKLVTIVTGAKAELEDGKGLLDRMGHAAGTSQECFDGGRADARSATSDLLAFVERVSHLKKWGEPDEEGQPFEPSDRVDDSHSCLMDLIDEARGLLAATLRSDEASSAKISTARLVDVDMTQIVGDYATPDEVREWRWIKSVASFAHRYNGQEAGVWEFVVNLALSLDDIPPRLVPILDEARRNGAAYVLFHQG